MKEQFAYKEDIINARRILTATKAKLSSGYYWTKFVCIAIDDVNTNERHRYTDICSILKREVLKRISPYSTVECFLSKEFMYPCGMDEETIERIKKESVVFRLNMLDEMIKELA